LVYLLSLKNIVGGTWVRFPINPKAHVSISPPSS
jgi:hypothetical protein